MLLCEHLESSSLSDVKQALVGRHLNIVSIYSFVLCGIGIQIGGTLLNCAVQCCFEKKQDPVMFASCSLGEDSSEPFASSSLGERCVTELYFIFQRATHLGPKPICFVLV